jgi:hypothetical protein
LNALQHKNSLVSTSSKYPYTSIGIDFYGGKTLSNGVNVYIIWYGKWSSSQKNIIQNFIHSLGPKNADIAGSVRRWWKINEVYYNSSGKYLSSDIKLSGEVTDNYSSGKNFTLDYGDYYPTSTIESVVDNAFTSLHLPKDPKGIYLVLTSSDVYVRIQTPSTSTHVAYSLFKISLSF